MIHQQIASQQQIGLGTAENSFSGPTNGQRKVNQGAEEDGDKNGEAIPTMRILSTLSVDTGSRGMGPLILRGRAGNLLSLITSGTIILALI